MSFGCLMGSLESEPLNLLTDNLAANSFPSCDAPHCSAALLACCSPPSAGRWLSPPLLPRRKPHGPLRPLRGEAGRNTVWCGDALLSVFQALPLRHAAAVSSSLWAVIKVASAVDSPAIACHAPEYFSEFSAVIALHVPNELNQLTISTNVSSSLTIPLPSTSPPSSSSLAPASLQLAVSSPASSLELTVKQPPIWQSLPVDLPALQPFLSAPRWIEFATSHPEDKAYALFYPPCNAEATAPPGSLPPLLVLSHGGCRIVNRIVKTMKTRIRRWCSVLASSMLWWRMSSDGAGDDIDVAHALEHFWPTEGAPNNASNTRQLLLENEREAMPWILRTAAVVTCLMPNLAGARTGTSRARCLVVRTLCLPAPVSVHVPMEQPTPSCASVIPRCTEQPKLAASSLCAVR